MALRERAEIAFSRPGGESCPPARERPVDLAHLSRQTMGDRGLEREVLSLFLQQIQSIRERMTAADGSERRTLAHTLKGSARGIGAFALADCAAGIEDHPADAAAIMRLASLIDEVRDFIAAIHR